MKIKCLKLECEVCGKVSTIQLFFRSNGDLAYGRARHYIGRVNGKPQFEYHQQTLQHLKQNIGLDIGQLNQSKLGSISQIKANSANNRLPAELLYMGSIPIPSSIANSKSNLSSYRSPLNDPQFEKWAKQMVINFNKGTKKIKNQKQHNILCD